MKSLTKEDIELGKKNYKYENYVENAFKYNNINLQNPDGWVIMDSVNNPFWKMDIFDVDTMAFNTSKLQDYFHEIYGGSKRDLFLPWHYTIDLVNEKPFIINTRPFMYKSLIPGYREHLSIMIIGDSNLDIYPGKYYKQIAHGIMNQFKYVRGYRLDTSPEKITYFTGKNFKPFELEKELH